MSNILGRAGLGLQNTTEDAKQAAFNAVEKLKAKKEETGRTIEEGLGGLKVMLGGKGVTKAILDDPIVKKFGSQLKKKAVDGVKKAGQKAIDEVSSRVSSLLPEGGEVAPAASASTSFVNPLFDPASADVAADAGVAADLQTAQAADLSELQGLATKGASRLQDGEDVFRTGYDEDEATGAEHLASGEGQLLRASDIEKGIQTTAAEEPILADAAVARETTLLGKMSAAEDFTNPEYLNVADNAGLAKALPEDDLEAGEFGTEASEGLTATETTRATQLVSQLNERAATMAEQAAQDTAVPETTASGADVGGAFAGDTAGSAAAGDLTASAGAAALGTTDAAAAAAAAAAGGGAAVGTDVAVGFGETILGALDAIPGLDLFTLAAGAALAGVAAGDKKKLAPQFMSDPTFSQAGTAFQAGFGNI